MARKDFYNEFVTALRAGYTYSLTDNLPDPDPILRKVGQDWLVYNELRSDAKVAACIEQRKASTLALMWSVSPAEGSADDERLQQRVDIVDRALKHLDIPKVISGILEAFLWGFQPLEVLWELRDGLVLPRDVVAKPPEWFVFDYAGTLKFRSKEVPLGEPLPPRKFLLAQHHPTFKNPYGQKVLPLCFWPVTFKKGGWRWWVSFTEKFGSPLLIGKYPRGIDQNEVDALQESLELLFQQATATIPNDSQLETISSSTQDSSQHKLLIDQCNSEIALAIVGQTLTSEIGANGSYAAAETHNKVRQEIAEGDKRMVERCLQQLVNWIYELNWADGQPPVFSLWQEDDVDKVLAERDQILSNAGVRFTKSYFQRVYGFQDDDFEMAEPAAPGTMPGAEFAEAPAKAPLKEATKGVKRGNKKAFNVDEYDLDAKKLSEFGKALLTQIVNLLDESSTFEEVRERLFKLYPKVDTEALEDSLARAFYIAHVEGRLSDGK